MTKYPIITVPATTTPSTKRRRDDSPVNHQQITEVPTLTLEQLKRQYGNMSVNNLKNFLPLNF